MEFIDKSISLSQPTNHLMICFRVSVLIFRIFFFANSFTKPTHIDRACYYIHKSDSIRHSHDSNYYVFESIDLALNLQFFFSS